MKPHDFVNILVSGAVNKYLNQEYQNNVQGKMLLEFPVLGFTTEGKILKAISDNGDLFYESSDPKTYIINHRNGTLIELNMNFDIVVERLPEIMKDVFK